MRNKTRLVTKVYNQHEGINFDETYARVARLEAIGKPITLSCIINFKLLKMDVKSAFLKGYIQKKMFVDQNPSFIN